MFGPLACNLGIHILLSEATCHLSHAIRKELRHSWPPIGLGPNTALSFAWIHLWWPVFMTRSWLWYRADLFESAEGSPPASGWLRLWEPGVPPDCAVTLNLNQTWLSDQRCSPQSWFTTCSLKSIRFVMVTITQNEFHSYNVILIRIPLQSWCPM